MSQSDLCNQPLKAITTNRGGARVTLILINNLNSCWFPPQFTSTLDEVILAKSAATILSDLKQGGLSYINHSLTAQMLSMDFECVLASKHESSPLHKARCCYEQ